MTPSTDTRVSAGFTPGPWFAADGGVVWHEAVVGVSHPECCGDFRPNGECCGLSVQGYHEELAQEQVAQCSPEDADLIAAAPELFDVLAEIIYWPSVRAAIGDKLVAKAEAALTKARAAS